MVVVDTNILVFAADADSLFHDPCRRVIEKLRHQDAAWFVTWGIVYEFLRVTTHPRVFRQPWSLTHSWNFVERLLESPSLCVLVPTDRHAMVAEAVFKELPHLQGNIVHDATTAILMREHGIQKIVTRDTDFHRFPFLTPVDPATE